MDISRPVLIRKAFRLEWATAGWMIVESAVALWSGLTAHSLVLIAFGADSLIELLSAMVLLWRLTVEIKRSARFSEETEQIASRLAGALLFVLAAYVLVSAGWSLWTHQGAEFSPPGLVVTCLAIPIMYELSNRKLRIAEALGSRALRADAIESVTCLYLAAVTALAIVVQFLLENFGAQGWWVAPVASLGIVWFLIKEGREAWSGD